MIEQNCTCKECPYVKQQEYVDELLSIARKVNADLEKIRVKFAREMKK